MNRCLFLLVVLLCCGKTLLGQQPLAYDFPKIKSSVTVPVRIPLSEISNVVNSSVQDLIFEDDSYTDNDNDQFKVKVWRTRPIRLIGGTEQNLLIEVPLKIWAEKGIGTLGVYTYQSTTFETVMYFSTKINLAPNWTISTETKPNGFRWVTKPVLDFGRVKIPVTGLVEKSLKKQQAEFSLTMDEMMKKQLDLRPYAVMAWNQFAQPFHISEEYNTWLKITPTAVQVTPLVFYANAIDLQLSVDTYSETFTGKKPPAVRPASHVPDFRFIQNAPNKFLLQTTANIPFTEATRLAEQQFLGKEFDFREGKPGIKITGIKVYGDDYRIVLEAQTEGMVSGTSYISGVPFYDEQQRKIVLEDVDFKLKTKNILHKTAAALFESRIVKIIRDEYGIPTAELEDSSRKSIVQAFNTEYYKGLKLSGKLTGLKPSKIILQPSGITAIIDTEAQLRLLIQNL
ncbi:DUF4403 family protein [Chryseobacterium sp. MFBS3-17]|uniref:DUF4403 family protein n=1 Tax=Chryseobacterium sp. MFBS3-17 TaxID=2886689 RepID=UPI001D0E13A9|nr:DUF4403 family protein [Chryseobacterium sp. MFBS3-17]MCC2591056.1 DUF4403 family protein [Chryseobacterium sp. MFBS3-17]